MDGAEVGTFLEVVQLDLELSGLGLVLVDFQSFVLHLLHQFGSLLGLGLGLLSLLLKILGTGSMELSLVQLDLDLLLKLSLLLVMVLRLGIEVLLEHSSSISMIIREVYLLLHLV